MTSASFIPDHTNNKSMTGETKGSANKASPVQTPNVEFAQLQKHRAQETAAYDYDEEEDLDLLALQRKKREKKKADPEKLDPFEDPREKLLEPPKFAVSYRRNETDQEIVSENYFKKHILPDLLPKRRAQEAAAKARTQQDPKAAVVIDVKDSEDDEDLALEDYIMVTYYGKVDDLKRFDEDKKEEKRKPSEEKKPNLANVRGNYIQYPPEPLKHKIKSWGLWGLNHFVSFVIPIMTTMNSLVAFNKIKLKNLLTEFPKLSTWGKFVAITSATCSHIINYLMNLQNIGPGLKAAWESFKKFHEHRFRNSVIYALAIGSAIAAASLGAAALSWTLSIVWQSLNAFATGFVMLTTRIFGLLNLSNRYNRHVRQGYYKRLLKRLEHDKDALAFLADLLSQDPAKLPILAKLYSHELQISLKDQPNDHINKATLHDLLVLIQHLQEENPKFKIKDLPLREKILTFFDWTIAVVAALVILPTFAHKALVGLQDIEEGIIGSRIIATGNKIGKSIGGAFLGLGSAFTYTNAVSQLRPVLTNAWQTFRSPFTFCSRKLVGLVALVSDILSGASGFNMTEDVGADSNHEDLFVDVLSVNSTATDVIAGVSASAVAEINGKFAMDKALPKKFDRNVDDAKTTAVVTTALDAVNAVAAAESKAPLAATASSTTQMKTKLAEAKVQPEKLKNVVVRALNRMRTEDLADETLETLKKYEQAHPPKVPKPKDSPKWYSFTWFKRTKPSELKEPLLLTEMQTPRV